MTDIINEEENSNQIPEEIEDVAVVDNGTTYESTETAIIAKEEADRAKLWAQESERQANLASGSADTAAQARDDAIAAKEYAEAAITDTNLITVATDLQSTPSNIKTVASNITDVTAVAGVSSAVTTVAGISSDVTSVAGNATDISAVAANNTNITAVAGNATNINAVNANKTNINAVAANNTNITAVAGDLTNINAVAADLTNIDNASANAQLAKDWAIKMDGMVASEDYSAKYYADQARQAASGAVDNKTITLNANNEHQAIGVINQNTADAVKIWSGTKEEYEDITHSNDTVYLVVGVGIYIGDIQVSAGGGGGEIGDIGIAPLGIDEAENKRRYLNGQVISQAQFVSFTDKLKAVVATYPALATSEVNWQATVTNSDLGQCGQFVIDDVNGTIRLPKVVNINGLQNLALLGGIKAESLPNITGDLAVSRTMNPNDQSPIVTGAFSATSASSTVIGTNSSSANVYKYSFDASRSSSTYQDDAPVQQEAVQYPYFIQVAEGVETSIDVSREIELNNPFSLLDYKYSEYELSNASWLLSNGQWNSGAVYQSVYNLLLAIYNGTETKAGVSVKLSTETYDDTDFVLNTSDTTFRLPTKVLMAGSKRVAGNGMTLGLTNGSQNAGLIPLNNGSYWALSTRTGNYGTNVGSGQSGSWLSNISSVGITTDETKSGIETSANGLYLYFYVGETVQDANIIAAGQALTDIADLKAHSIVETYVNGTSWYRVYSDGWCEQGGIVSSTAAGVVYTINFIKPFSACHLMTINGVAYQNVAQANDSIGPINGSQFNWVTGRTQAQAFYWYACGYIS